MNNKKMFYSVLKKTIKTIEETIVKNSKQGLEAYKNGLETRANIKYEVVKEHIELLCNIKKQDFDKLKFWDKEYVEEFLYDMQ